MNSNMQHEDTMCHETPPVEETDACCTENACTEECAEEGCAKECGAEECAEECEEECAEECCGKEECAEECFEEECAEEECCDVNECVDELIRRQEGKCIGLSAELIQYINEQYQALGAITKLINKKV